MNEATTTPEQEKAVQAITERYIKQLEKMSDDMAEEIAKVFSDSQVDDSE